MVLKLTEEQWKEVCAAGDEPVEAVDELGNRCGVLMSHEWLDKNVPNWERMEWHAWGRRALAVYDAKEPWPADDD